MEKKTIGRKLLMAMAVLFCSIGLIFVSGTSAQAATVNKALSGSTGWSSGTHTFKADMNGNGAYESYSMKITSSYSDYLTRMTVTLSKKTILSLSAEYCYHVHVRYISLSSKHNYLQIWGTGEDMNTEFNYLYVYSGGKLVKCADLNQYCGCACQITKVTSSTITVYNWSEPSMIGQVHYYLSYKYSSGNKFTLVSSIVNVKSDLGSMKLSDGLAPYFAKNQFKAAKKLNLYTNSKATTLSYSLPSGKWAKLIKICVTKKTIHAKFQYGTKTGWLLNVADYKYTWSNTQRKFTGAYFYGVLDRAVS